MGIATKTGLDENGQSSSVFEGRAIGDIIPHFGTTAPPGTLVCDGSEVSREAYHELFEEIGSLVGQGDGSTTFNLPDLRGRWMMGADAERAAGEEVAEGLPNIQGAASFRRVSDDSSNTLSVFGSTSNYVTSGAIRGALTEGLPYVDYIGIGYGTSSGQHGDEFSLDASRSSSIYGASQHVTPASVAVLPCIVYE